MARTKSKHWSEKDLRKMDRMMKAAEAEGLSKYAAKQRVGEYFGVTPLAIDVRYNRWLRGIKGKTPDTTKVPIKRKYGKRGKYKKVKFSPAALEAIQGKAAAEVQSVLTKRKYTKKVDKDAKPAIIEGRSMTFKITNVNVDLAAGTITVSY